MASEQQQQQQQTPKLAQGSETMAALEKQIDYYFSRQNLATDAFLVSQMNAAKWVPVAVIANFRKVRSFTEDREVLVAAMRRCKNCTVSEDGTLVQPKIKAERKILILRDIPADTPQEEVAAIFDFVGAGKVVSIRSDIGDTWFVTFASQEECMGTFMALPSRTFRGNPVRARIKSENIVRGYYKSPTNRSGSASPADGATAGDDASQHVKMVPVPVDGAASSVLGPAGQGAQWGPTAGGYYAQQQQQQQQQQGANPYGGWAPVYGQYGGAWTPQAGAYAPAGVPQGGRGGFGGPRGQVALGPDGQPLDAAAVRRARKAEKRKRLNARKKQEKAGGDKGQGVEGAEGAAAGGRKMAPRSRPQPQLGPEHFPALPTTGPKPARAFPSVYQRYSRKDMAEVVNALRQKGPVERPESLPSAAECPVVSDEPAGGTELLLPFPVMFPASPSPALRPTAMSDLLRMPELDLSKPAGPSAVPSSRSTAAAAGGRPTAAEIVAKSAPRGLGPAAAPGAPGARSMSMRGQTASPGLGGESLLGRVAVTAPPKDTKASSAALASSPAAASSSSSSSSSSSPVAAAPVPVSEEESKPKAAAAAPVPAKAAEAKPAAAKSQPVWGSGKTAAELVKKSAAQPTAWGKRPARPVVPQSLRKANAAEEENASPEESGEAAAPKAGAEAEAVPAAEETAASANKEEKDASNRAESPANDDASAAGKKTAAAAAKASSQPSGRVSYADLLKR